MTSDAEPATYADIEALPDNVVGEIIKGVLYASLRPAAPHSSTSAELMISLGPGYRRGQGGPGGWRFFFEPELHLQGNVLVPDLAGWRRERMEARPLEAAIKTRPDWVCEILSPSTAALDRAKKLPLYGQLGVPAVWLVDPLAKTLEVYLLRKGRWLLEAVHIGDGEIHAPPFEAVAISLSALWDE